MSKQTVYNILASAKKEPVKVELALVDDARKMHDLIYEKVKASRGIDEELRVAARAINAILVRVDAYIKDFQSLDKQSQSVVDDIKAALAAVGLEPKDSFELINLITARVDVLQAMDDFTDYIQFYSRK
jgi:hypothetical protein